MVKSVDLDQILCSRGTFYPNVLKFVYYSEITSRILTVAYYKTTMFTCETHGIFVGILIIEYQSPISDFIAWTYCIYLFYGGFFCSKYSFLLVFVVMDTLTSLLL